MTTRTPIESLTLAVQYLDALMDDSTPGTWNLWTEEAENDKSDALYLKPNGKRSDGALVVALHATAPAIRELLSDEITRMNDRIGQFTVLQPTAEALLSTSHAEKWITDREANRG